MPPKVKKDPMAPILVHEDVFLRGKKLFDAKIVVPPGKGELTQQELCLPPSAHSDPQLKPAVQYYLQGGIVRLTDSKHIEPSIFRVSFFAVLLDPLGVR